MGKHRKKNKARWLTDYDMTLDKCYKRPMCVECYAPVIRDEDGSFRCVACGKDLELTEGMVEWISKREGSMVQVEDCMVVINTITGKKSGCGGKGCVEKIYHKNPITLEWEFKASFCSKCGKKIIV